MYNDKSAKDLLAQYPKRMAEGGAATQEPMPPKRSATQEIEPVVAKRPKLTPLDQLSVSPSTLSYSQQMARDRAAKQELLNNVLAQSNAPVDSLKRQQLLQQVYKGDINAENINEKLLYPMYEERVRNAYNLLGRSGTAIPENTYLDQLKAGTLSGADFQNKFLTDAANYAGADKFEATQLASINKARTALGLPLLEAPKLKARFTGGNFFGSRGVNTGFGVNSNNKGMGSFFSKSLPLLKPAAAPAVVTPVEFGGPAPTQLFADGGEVGHPNEAADNVASWGRKQQENLAGLVGLGDEVKFANEIPTRYFPKDEQLDGRGDAMRHLLVQAQIQKKYGDGAAELAGWLHENFFTGNQSDEEKAMDDYNDALGRKIGARSADKADMAFKALQAIKSGEAKTILKGTKPKKFEKGGEAKKEEQSVFGRKGKEAKIVEGNPYNTEGPPITDNGPSPLDVASFINSFVPITSDIQSAAEAYQAFKDKDYVGVGGGLAGMIPFVPNITKYVKGAKQLHSERTKEDAIKTAIEEYKEAYKKQGRFAYNKAGDLENTYKDTYAQQIASGWDKEKAHADAMERVRRVAQEGQHSNWFGGGGTFSRQKNSGMSKMEDSILERLKTSPNISKEKGANNRQSEYGEISSTIAQQAAKESYNEFENKMLGMIGKAKKFEKGEVTKFIKSKK